MIPVNLHHCNIFSGFAEKSSSALIRAYAAFTAMLNMFKIECNNCHRRGECQPTGAGVFIYHPAFAEPW